MRERLWIDVFLVSHPFLLFYLRIQWSIIFYIPVTFFGKERLYISFAIKFSQKQQQQQKNNNGFKHSLTEIHLFMILSKSNLRYRSERSLNLIAEKVYIDRLFI